MPTLANIDGRTLVPNASQGLDALAKAFQSSQEQRAKQEQAQAKQVALDEALGAIFGGGRAAGSGVQTFPLESAPLEDAPAVTQRVAFAPSRQQTAALARLAALDPNASKEIRAILDRGNKQEVAAARAEVESNVRMASVIEKQPTYQKKRAAIESIGRRLAAEGKPLDRVLHLMNLSEPDLDLDLQRMKVMGTDLKTLTEPREVKAPTTREVKRGDEIVTEQFNPTTGAFEEIGRSARFNPNAGVKVVLPGASSEVAARPLTAEERATLNLTEEEADGLIVNAKGEIKALDSTTSTTEIDRANARREAAAKQGSDLIDGYVAEFEKSKPVGGIIPPGGRREALSQRRQGVVAWVAKNVLGTPGAEPSPALYDRAEEMVPDFSGAFDRANFTGKIKALRDLAKAGREGEDQPSGDTPKKRIRYDAQGNRIDD